MASNTVRTGRKVRPSLASGAASGKDRFRPSSWTEMPVDGAEAGTDSAARAEVHSGAAARTAARSREVCA